MYQQDPYVQKVANLPKVKKYLEDLRKDSTRYSFRSSIVNFNRFLEDDNLGNADSIVDDILSKKHDVYVIIRSYISYLNRTKGEIIEGSTKAYVTTIRSFLTYHDIDIVPSKFKNKVKNLPKKIKEKRKPIDTKMIRDILQNAGLRLKSFLLLQLSSGARPKEICQLRNKDINWNSDPMTAELRARETKTNTDRTIYFSSEAKYFLKQWQTLKYRNREPRPNDYLFASYDKDIRPKSLYERIRTEYNEVLDRVGLGDRKDFGLKKRRLIGLHTNRGFLKTLASNAVGKDFSEELIGHAGDYYLLTDEQMSKTYKEKVEKHATFLDFTSLEHQGQTQDARIKELEIENMNMKREIVDMKEGFKKFGTAWDLLRPLVTDSIERGNILAELKRLDNYEIKLKEK